MLLVYRHVRLLPIVSGNNEEYYIMNENTFQLIKFASTIETKYNLVKTALISDVISECISDIHQYLSNPIYQSMYSDPITKTKIRDTLKSMSELKQHLDDATDIISEGPDTLPEGS